MLIVFALAATVLGYGYWHVVTHGTLYIFLYDVAAVDQSGRLFPAEIRFVDASGVVLAKGRTDDRYGVVSIAHPEVGYCQNQEQLAPVSHNDRTAWPECFARQSRWLMTWVRKVHALDLTFGNCRLTPIPARIMESNDDWWLWWVPHPHIGGKPYTNFFFRLSIDSETCTVLADNEYVT